MCLSIKRFSKRRPEVFDTTGSSGTSPETAHTHTQTQNNNKNRDQQKKKKSKSKEAEACRAESEEEYEVGEREITGAVHGGSGTESVVCIRVLGF